MQRWLVSTTGIRLIRAQRIRRGFTSVHLPYRGRTQGLYSVSLLMWLWKIIFQHLFRDCSLFVPSSCTKKGHLNQREKTDADQLTFSQVGSFLWIFLWGYLHAFLFLNKLSWRNNYGKLAPQKNTEGGGRISSLVTTPVLCHLMKSKWKSGVVVDLYTSSKALFLETVENMEASCKSRLTKGISNHTRFPPKRETMMMMMHGHIMETMQVL